jgi:hypothetical protein
MSALADIDAEELWNNSKGLLIPGMAGGAAGAGLGTYLTSRKKKGETPSERRKRVLRNAMIGAAAGTTAGATLPAGVNLLGEASRSGAFTDTLEDLIADSAILGAGGAAGFAGGTWAKDKVLTQVSESTRVNTEVRELYNNMAHGNKAKSIVQFAPDIKGGDLSLREPDVRKMLITLQQGSRANTQDFFDDAVRKTKGKFKTQFKVQALKHYESKYKYLVDNGSITKNVAFVYAKQDVVDLMKRDSVKTTLSIKAEDSVRRAMQDIGLTMPEEDISDFFKRLADPKRWANRSDFLKRMIGLKGSSEVGKIWGGIPTDSGRWKSFGRRLVKGSFPAVGLAAGGLLASNFI